MPTPASFEQAYSQGMVEGSRLNHHRVQRMKYWLGASAAFAVLAFGYAVEERAEAETRPDVIVVNPSALTDSTALLRECDKG